ncbi:MAG: ATP-binding protein, partial [Chloroflexota bacterium]
AATQPLIKIFPELIGLEEVIQALIDESEEALLIPQLHRSATESEQERYLNIQLEGFSEMGENVLVTVSDVTREAHLEQIIRQERNELRLNKIELEKYMAELEARNEDLRAFVHTVTHELKHPLTTVVGYSQLLNTRLHLMTEESQQNALETIERTAVRMGDIISELLLLAQIGRDDIDVTPLDMRHIQQSLEQRLSYLIELHQTEIVWPDTWPQAIGYGPWVEEAWLNYLTNAIKYGGKPPKIIVEGLQQDDGMVRFSVRDNGLGLTQEDQQQLFIPFSRLEQVEAKGHGLGLSIVQRIIEKLGGQVGVESQAIPGQGSTFFFTLPAI